MALRADGKFHTYQFPLGWFNGGTRPIFLEDLGSIEGFWVGANWTAGGAVRTLVACKPRDADLCSESSDPSPQAAGMVEQPNWMSMVVLESCSNCSQDSGHMRISVGSAGSS